MKGKNNINRGQLWSHTVRFVLMSGLSNSPHNPHKSVYAVYVSKTVLHMNSQNGSILISGADMVSGFYSGSNWILLSIRGRLVSGDGF